MPRKPGNLDTLKFSLDLLRRIPRNSKVSALTLHKQLRAAGYERSLRTVQRLLAQLTEAFDIEVDDRSEPYGYRWKPGARGFSLPTLSEQESLLLTLAEQQLQHLLPSDLLAAMQPFFEQARKQLFTVDPTGKRRPERDWVKKVRVLGDSQPLLPPSIRPGIFEAVSMALYHDELLAVGYRNTDKRLIEARVAPLGLIQQGNRLYLLCQFDGYRDRRRLALHRLESAERLPGAAQLRSGFDIRAIDAGAFGFAAGDSIRLQISLTREDGWHLTESPLSADQIVVEKDGRYEISATVVHSESLLRWLRGFGPSLIIIGPQEIREILATPIK